MRIFLISIVLIFCTICVFSTKALDCNSCRESCEQVALVVYGEYLDQGEAIAEQEAKKAFCRCAWQECIPCKWIKEEGCISGQ